MMRNNFCKKYLVCLALFLCLIWLFPSSIKIKADGSSVQRELDSAKVPDFLNPSQMVMLNGGKYSNTESTVPGCTADTTYSVTTGTLCSSSTRQTSIWVADGADLLYGIIDNGISYDATTIHASGGGSGDFTYLIVFTENDNGTIQYFDSQELGDRITVNSLSHKNGIFLLIS